MPAIVKAKYPILRAVEALAVTIPLFLLIFSRIYLSNSLDNPAVVHPPLDHTTALYFTVTVFATVGFGDIVAATGGMRSLVTVQMLLNLVVLGLVIRLLSSAAQRGVAQETQLAACRDSRASRHKRHRALERRSTGRTGEETLGLTGAVSSRRRARRGPCPVTGRGQGDRAADPAPSARAAAARW